MRPWLRPPTRVVIFRLRAGCAMLASDGCRAPGVALGTRLQARTGPPRTGWSEIMKRIIVETPGGPEQMKVVEAPKPVPGPKEAVVAIAFSGVNFIDVYFRTGLYKADVPIVARKRGVRHGRQRRERRSPMSRQAIASPTRWCAARMPNTLPFPPRSSSRSRTSVDFADRGRGHAAGHDGSLPDAFHLHAERRQTPASCTLPLAAPAASSCRWPSISAHACSARCRPRTRHGRFATLGADEAIIYTTQDFEAEVKRLTNGRGVDVVYDSVGKTTFDKSLNVLRPRGMMALFGQSSGLGPPFDPAILNAQRLTVSDAADPRASLCSIARNCSGASATCSATSRQVP